MSRSGAALLLLGAHLAAACDPHSAKPPAPQPTDASPAVGDAVPQPTPARDAAPPSVADAEPSPEALSLRLDTPREGAQTFGPTVRLEGQVFGGRPPWRASVEPGGRAADATALTVEGDHFTGSFVAPLDGEVAFVVVVEDADQRTTRLARRVSHARLGPDVTAPTIEITAPTEGARVGSRVTLEGVVVDPTLADERSSGLSRVRIDQRPLAVDAQGRFRATLEVDMSGPWLLSLTATDVAGNEARAERRLDADVDPPSLAVLSPEPGARVVDTTFDIVVSAIDPSGPVSVSLDDGTPLDATVDDAFIVRGVTRPAGATALDVVAVDALGNRATQRVAFVRVDPLPDATPPRLTLTAPTDLSLVDAALTTFEGEARDVPGGSDERVSGVSHLLINDAEVAVVEGRFRVQVPVGLGRRTVRVAARDTAGLVSEPQTLVVFGGAPPDDARPPTLELESPTEGTLLYADTVVFTGRVVDLDSGPRSVRVDGIEVPTDLDGRFVLGLEDRPGGPQPATVSAFDWAGNETAQVVHFSRRPGLDGGSIEFTDVTQTAFRGAESPPRASSDTAGIGVGAALIDADGDGDLDLVNTGADREGFDPATPPGLYLNIGAVEGTILFERSPDALSPALDGIPTYAVAAGDADGDGDPDLYFCVDGQDRLYRNDGGRFVDVTVEAGITDAGGRQAQALFADFDGDGLEDIYVSGFPTERAAQLSYPPNEPLPPRAMLFMNRGGLRFEDVAARAGLNTELASTHASLVFDLDADGDLDIYDANDVFAQGRGDQVWIQTGQDVDGAPRFEPRAEAWGLDVETYRMGAALADVDGDLRPDLFLTDVDPKRLYPLWGELPVRDRAEALGLANDRRADPARPGMTEALWGWGADWTDLDRDGFLDLLVVNGSVASTFSRNIFFQVPYVFRSDRGEAFVDVTEAAGLNAIEPFNRDLADNLWARGAYAGDLDGDGDRDFVLSSMLGPYRVLRNDAVHVGRALRLSLRGTHSGPAAVGARVVVTADGWSHAAFCSAGGNTRGQGEATLEVPLGRVRRVERVEVNWPSGLAEVIEPPNLGPLDTLEITEPTVWTLDARRVPRGGATTLRWRADAVLTARLDDRALAADLNGFERVARIAHDGGPSGWRRLTFARADRPVRMGASLYFE